MKTQSGFTLVEALVTGVLSTIVAGTLVSVLAMVNQQMQMGMLENRLGRIQSVVSEQIRASMRKSWGALQAGEALVPPLTYQDFPAVAGTNEIVFGNKNGQPMAKYRIDPGGFLQEWHDADNGDYYPFQIGGEVVHVDPQKSSFSLFQGRKTMTFTLAYVLGDKTLPLISDTIQCRNFSN